MTPTPTTVNAHTESKVLLRVEEAAEALSIGRTTMYRLISSGEVESVEIGTRRLVPLTAIQNYVASLLAAA